MHAIIAKSPGDASQLELQEVDRPTLKEKEILVKVHYTAVNRADTLQRQGRYPAPAGASQIMGLECVGEVSELGQGASKFKVGERVMCLLAGGGYAQYATVDEGSVMRIPDNLSYNEAAALPEVFLTAYLIAVQLGGLKKDDVVLIHAAASGVGTALIQLCKMYGAHAIATVGSDAKVDYCTKLGAHTINYKTEAKFSDAVKKACASLNPPRDGVDLLLDPVGASHALENLASLGTDSRWILYGLLGGFDVEKFPLSAILQKRIRLQGSTLRARSLTFKAELVANVERDCLAAFADGRLKPILETTIPLAEMRRAHELMESNATIGKIVIKVI
jgi:tumor protein p53-inducible protein 3